MIMALTKEEKAVNLMLSSPQFPTACVEGTFKEKRAVFICLIDYRDPKNPKGGYDITPLARLLEEDDLKHIKGHEGNPLGAAEQKRIITPGGGADGGS
jgi:hypothetical protein